MSPAHVNALFVKGKASHCLMTKLVANKRYGNLLLRQFCLFLPQKTNAMFRAKRLTGHSSSARDCRAKIPVNPAMQMNTLLCDLRTRPSKKSSRQEKRRQEGGRCAAQLKRDSCSCLSAETQVMLHTVKNRLTTQCLIQLKKEDRDHKQWQVTHWVAVALCTGAEKNTRVI